MFTNNKMVTNKEQYNKRHGFPKDTSHSIKDISKISKVPTKVLSEVKSRGIGAYKTNPESVRLKGTFKKDPKAPLSKKLGKEQWANARILSFVNKLEGRQKLNHDRDLLKDIPRLKGKDLDRI